MSEEYTTKTATYVIRGDKLIPVLDDETAKLHRNITINQLIHEGYTITPPPEKPEFKPGDPVEVWNDDINARRLTRYERLSVSKDEGPYIHRCMNGGWKHCRHAKTWINWQTGPVPLLDGAFLQIGFVHEQNGKAWIYMHDGRWAWMP